ncbi:PEP-CTERM sorting domain-containing protein [Kiritimatiellota bacterium B12222]|nr:PEP-CTERM sorting domain-containing protein [Kiritimatiellota bacterium B12222]
MKPTLLSFPVCLVLFVAFGLSTLSQAAELIDSSSFTARASTWANGDYRTPISAFNGAGLSFNGSDYEHDTSPNDHMWLTDPNVDISESWVLVDMAAAYDLDSIRVWNYNESGQAKYLRRGVNEAKIWVTTAGTIPVDESGNFDFSSNGWSQVGGGVTFEQAPGTDGYVAPAANTVALGGVTARYLAIEVDSNHGTNEVGLSEVQLFAVPEPSSVVLLFLGLGGLFVAGRRKK